MMGRISRSALFALGSSLLLVTLVVGLALSMLLSRAQWAAETLQALEPRYARLQGLEGERPRFEAALARTNDLLRAIAYPATLDSGRVGADLQQRLRTASEEAGFTVVSSRVGSVAAHDGFEEIPLSLRLEGSLVNLEAMLRALPALRPVVQLRSLSVNSATRRRAARADLLRIEITVAAARLAS